MQEIVAHAYSIEARVEQSLEEEEPLSAVSDGDVYCPPEKVARFWTSSTGSVGFYRTKARGDYHGVPVDVASDIERLHDLVLHELAGAWPVRAVELGQLEVLVHIRDLS